LRNEFIDSEIAQSILSKISTNEQEEKKVTIQRGK
jgi:hypothetical protein